MCCAVSCNPRRFLERCLFPLRYPREDICLSNLTNRTTTYSYDAHGRMTGTTDPTGTSTYYLDLNSNLTNLTENGQSLQQTADAYNMRIPINQCQDAPPRLPSFAIWVAHRAISGKVKTEVEAAELFCPT